MTTYDSTISDVSIVADRYLPANALPAIVKIMGAGWKPPIEASVIIGFQCKLVGLDWSTDDEIAGIMAVLTKVGFLELDPTIPRVRINPVYAMSKL